MEFAALKRQLDRLLVHAHDSLSLLSRHANVKPHPATQIGSVVDNVLLDTTTSITKDTIVRKKPGLLRRIFNSKDDTIVIASEHNSVDVERIAVLRANLSEAQSALQNSFLGDIASLRHPFPHP